MKSFWVLKAKLWRIYYYFLTDEFNEFSSLDEVLNDMPYEKRESGVIYMKIWYCKKHNIALKKSKFNSHYCPKCMPQGKGMIDMNKMYSDTHELMEK